MTAHSSASPTTRSAEVFDLLDDPVLLVDANGLIAAWNRAAARLFDVDGLEVSPETVEDSYRLAALAELLALAEGPFTLPMPAPDGERIYHVALRERPAGGLLVQLHDATDLTRTRHALQEADTRFRTLTRTAMDAIVMMDMSGRIRVWNPAAERIFGWTADEALGIDLRRLLHPAEDSRGRNGADSWAEVASDHGKLRQLPACRRDGTPLLVEMSLSPAPAGTGWGAQAILRDITARIEAQEKLRLAEQRWQFALEGGGDGVWDWNVQTNAVYFSPRYIAMMGYGPDEFGQTLESFLKRIHPDDLERVNRQVRGHFAHSEETYVCEFRFLHKDGEFRWIHARGRLIEKDKGGKPLRMVGTHRDITQARLADEALQQQLQETQRLNRRLEEAQSQILQSEKMASIGQLSAGIAHEMNTPLGFVNSNLGSMERYFLDLMDLVGAYEYAEKASPADAPAFAAARQARVQCELDYLKEDLPALFSETKEGLERVQRIVRDLKDFSHAGSEEQQYADVHKNLDSTLNIVRNEIKPQTEVLKDYGKLPEIWCQPSLLNQVFMNVLCNAAQSIPGQGTITLRTREENGEVLVEISDTGCGIPPEHLKRIFDPFFTTKPVGQGTGLGLSLVYSIVRKHGGRIEVDSQPGQGSTFRIILPLKTQPSP